MCLTLSHVPPKRVNLRSKRPTKKIIQELYINYANVFVCANQFNISIKKHIHKKLKINKKNSYVT